MFRFMRTWLALWVLGLLLAACGGGSDGNSENIGARVHVLAAPSGQLIPGKSPQEWTLVLEKVYPDTFWFEDRPGRSSGEQTVGDYVNATWSKAYGDIEPHATLHFEESGSSALQSIYAKLSQPVYDEKNSQLRVPMLVLANSVSPATTVTLSVKKLILEVLNNAVDEKEVASYMQHAAQATIEPSGSAGQYRLLLSGASDRTLLVDNAPGQYFDSRLTRDFSAQWRTLFADSLPNVAIHGTTESGKMRLYFLTLSNPQYDQAAGTLRYDATALGEGAIAPQTLNQVALNIDSGEFSRFPGLGKGTAYQGFSHGYDPSSANSTRIYFGSDIARSQLGSLWGDRSYLAQASCEPYCRNDLKTMKDMGINLVRVYDWDARNDHKPFLDYAHSLGLKVIVPISNWLPCHPEHWQEGVKDYFNEKNFGTGGPNGNWHPAIAGVTISNELDGNYRCDTGKMGEYTNALKLAGRFLKEAADRKFSTSVRVGIPITFAEGRIEKTPGWDRFDELIKEPSLAPYMGQIMLNPNTYNDREYLFRPGGWTETTYARYLAKGFKLPILFTEIGMNRVERSDAPSFVKNQLEGALEYQKAHPEQLLGAIHFMFDNKIWKQTGGNGAPETDTEGAYGAFRHGAVLKTIQTVVEDYNFWVDAPAGPGSFTIDKLETTSIHEAVTSVYLNSSR